MSKNNIVKINILQLKYILYNSNISNEEMVRIGTMIDENKEVLELHKYKISETTDGRWRTSIPGGKRLTKPTYEELLKALIPVYIKEAKTATMALLFDEYIARQVEDCRTPATIQKKIYSWNTFLRDTDIAKKPIANIKVDELRSFVLKLIKENSMKQKYFNSWLKPLLNGI